MGRIFLYADPVADLADRFAQNPLLRPEQVAPSRAGLKVECIMNPGAFRHDGQTWLLARVAERPEQRPGFVSFPIMENGVMQILEFAVDDPFLDISDPRRCEYRGEGYLSTLSHLRLFFSEDGARFTDAGRLLVGDGDAEGFGIEDCRVTRLGDTFLLTYTAVSRDGYGVGMRTTRDWRSFKHHGFILPPANKDCAVFEERIGGAYVCLHRPSAIVVGGHDLWMAFSPDLAHWGRHRCVARRRPGKWDSARIGAGAAPIRTKQGWLEIYHGADARHRYCLGAMLFALDDPTRVVARSAEPIMEPLMEYEQKGFFGSVVFTNGHVLEGDTLTIYYGASDSTICGARFSVSEILSTLP